MVAAETKAIVHGYIDGVLSGDIVTGRLVRAAVERHVRDLKTGYRRGLWFDETAASHVIEFFKFLKHSKGEWAGQPFELAPFQQFVLWCLFGWKNAEDGTRRFRRAYCELARKNGKSTLMAGIGLYLLVADGEAGADIYTAATKKEQAKIIHGEAVRMVKRSPDLRAVVDVYRNNLSVPATDSKYEPMAADADTEDGLNPHGALIDELHAHPNGDILDVLDTALGSRTQPLVAIITTAGTDRQSVCWAERETARRAVETTSEAEPGFDDTIFAFIAALDEEDDWQDESCWIKANPNLGVSCKLANLRNQFRKAKNSPRFQNAFRQKNLNQWTAQETRWLDMDVWHASAGIITPDHLSGLPCTGGLDLGSRIDLTARAYTFRVDDAIKLLLKFWIPEETAAEREKEDKVPYRYWAEQGLVTFTPGNVTDYVWIEEDIKRDNDRYQIAAIAFDPWNAQQTATNLAGYGIEMVEFGQTLRNFNEPCKELERLLRKKRLHHGNHPVLNWNAENIEVYTDVSGNIRPVKPEHGSKKRIDGLVAAIMALALLTQRGTGESVYETRELLELDF